MRLPITDYAEYAADIGAELSEVHRRIAEAHETRPPDAFERRVRALVKAARNLGDQHGELFVHHWTALAAALAYFKDWEP